MKKLPVLFSLVGVLSLFFTSGVLAKPKKSAVLIENLTYVATGYDGLSFTANGTGTINCNGVEACVTAGLHGETMNFTQDFVMKIFCSAGADNGLKVATRGQAFTTTGTFDDVFKGRGRGEGVCTEDTFSGSLTIRAKIKGGNEGASRGGGKITFDLNFVITHTSAGFVVSELSGTAAMKGDFSRGV